MSDQPFLRSAEYRSQIDPANPGRIRGPVLRKLKDFLTAKRMSPRDSFGGSDTAFIAIGPLGKALPGLRHAHLSQDLSIVYRLVGNVIYLYGIYGHKELGTGDAAKINIQKQMATKLSGMKFSE